MAKEINWVKTKTSKFMLGTHLLFSIFLFLIKICWLQAGKNYIS